MDRKKLEALRTRLEQMAEELALADSKTAADRAPVELDQQSVGRLSRMEAMQVQAMAAAQGRRRSAEIQRIRQALKRIDEGEYGYCLECGEEIGERRLDLDPAAARCVDCAR